MRFIIILSLARHETSPSNYHTVTACTFCHLYLRSNGVEIYKRIDETNRMFLPQLMEYEHDYDA